MVRSDKIKSALFGGVAFRNPTDTEYNIVDATNYTSTSGLYFDDASNFVSIRNIKDAQGDSNISNAEFNTYLTNLHKQVIDDVCRDVLRSKSKMLFSHNLYPYEKKFSETIEPLTGFVCFEIEPRIIDGAIAKVEWIEVSLNEAKTFNLYLFNSNLKTAIKTKAITTVANESTIVNVEDWFIDDDTTYKGGKFYLGYFEADIGTAKPIARNFENSSLQVQNNFYRITPIRVQVSGILLTIGTDETLSDTNGLNIGINVYNDFTKDVINNKSLFFPVIQYGMAVKVLDLIRTSIRSNLTTRLSKDLAPIVETELYGNNERAILGISGKYAERVKSLREMMFYEPLMTIGTLK